MDVKLDNPFLISGYESPTYFCDREKETRDLLDTLSNGRNVTLLSPRRMGKTGLIKHVYHFLKEHNPQTTVIYIDLFSTWSLQDFTKTFATAVLGQLDSNPVKIMKKAITFFKGLRPFYSVDPLSGQPKLGLDILIGQEEQTLEQVFHYLKQSGKTCYIAFDEFQQIAYYPEKNIEGLLRAHIQDLHNVHFIFSGSKEHMLQAMFHSPKRPFYQSTSEKTIGAIDLHRYYDFAAAFFKAQGRELPESVFEQVYQRYEGYTWYIQMVMNRIYAKSSRSITVDLAEECIRDILWEYDSYYQFLLRAYSKGQVKLIRAIAREGKVKEILSGAFISKHGLTATSSVKSALKRMLDEEIVYLSEDGYMIYDRFFGEWMSME